ncbi:MAG: alanine racemase [Verrucomicrobiota bacterium]|jgi:alanine racemase
MKPCHRCWAEVSLDALRGNLAWLRHCVGPEVKIMTVVKADAYGHGLRQIAGLLMQAGTDFFGVANLTEAHAVRSVGKGWPVLMLGACLRDEMDLAIRDNVQVTISSTDEAEAFSSAAHRLRRRAIVHMKVDTGMGRLGVAPEKAVALARHITRHPRLKLEGVYTHFASAEDDAPFSAEQALRFGKVVEALADSGLKPPLIHANNSAALLHQPGTVFNLIRPGLLVYGVSPPAPRRRDTEFGDHLRAALSLKARVTLVKDIPKNGSLSYGRSFVAPRRMRVATIAAGYGDGYLRSGSNRAMVLLHGRRCPVVGRITMDQTLIDVSRLERVVSGDEVVLIGRQGAEQITASELAGWCGTIPWEVLTAIAHRVPRLYQGGQAS